MNPFITFNQLDLLIINFDNILDKSILEWLNELDKNNLIQKDNYKYIINLRNKDVKNLFLHYLIYNLLKENTLNKLNQKFVVFIQPKIIDKNKELFNYCDYNLFRIILCKYLTFIQNKIPIFLYFSKIILDFQSYPNIIYSTGLYQDLFYNIDIKYKQFCRRKYTFQSLKKFIQKYNLRFLSEVYFNKLYNKMVLFSSKG